MNNQEKKEYLERYKWTSIEVKKLKEQIDELKASALPGAISYDGMPHGSGGGKFDLSDYAARLDGLIQKYRQTLRRKMKELHDITEALDQLERKDSESIKFATLLRLRYVYGYDWEQIATDMSYSEDYVKRRLHSLALTAFEPIENNQTCS
jgi:hypothetical protein